MLPCRRLVYLVTIAIMVFPLQGVHPDWIPADITPSATLSFPPGGGTCTTGLRVPANGLVKGTVLNVTGLPSYTNETWSANVTEIWEMAGEKTNLSLSPEGIGLCGFGSWWEETAEEAWGWRRSWTGIGRAEGVYVCTYREVFPVAHFIQERYIRMKEEGEIGEYRRALEAMKLALDRIHKKADTIETALTTISNANAAVKDEIASARRQGAMAKRQEEGGGEGII